MRHNERQAGQAQSFKPVRPCLALLVWFSVPNYKKTIFLIGWYYLACASYHPFLPAEQNMLSVPLLLILLFNPLSNFHASAAPVKTHSVQAINPDGTLKAVAQETSAFTSIEDRSATWTASIPAIEHNIRVNHISEYHGLESDIREDDSIKLAALREEGVVPNFRTEDR